MARNHQLPLQSSAPPPGRSRQRALAVAVSIGAHVAVIAALLGLQFQAPDRPETRQPALMLVSLNPSPEPPGAAGGAADGAQMPDLTPPPPPDASVPAISIVRPAAAAAASNSLSAAQLAGAARVGDGGAGGGACDMARAVQQMLRRDPLVRAAVTEAGRLGQATLLWDGDWVRSGSQDGKGMAAVRQAILWEVGFAPEACRNTPVRGMVLLSLADGATRFAIGAGVWRWSDLLGLKSARR